MPKRDNAPNGKNFEISPEEYVIITGVMILNFSFIDDDKSAICRGFENENIGNRRNKVFWNTYGKGIV